jgi:hypothetical protein
MIYKIVLLEVFLNLKVLICSYQNQKNEVEIIVEVVQNRNCTKEIIVIIVKGSNRS